MEGAAVTNGPGFKGLVRLSFTALFVRTAKISTISQLVMSASLSLKCSSLFMSSDVGSRVRREGHSVQLGVTVLGHRADVTKIKESLYFLDAHNAI